MNCANHPDRERSAFCQNCGKPLCSECIRNLGTSIYCEPCYTARTNPTPPPPGTPYAGYQQPGAPGYPPVGQSAPPNPGLAALLGFIPGVGAMYNEQYGKGIVHLMVFAILISLADHVSGIFGLFIAGWVCYMVIEAHHTARARRDGTPLPNPFGLNDIAERLGFGRAWPGTSYSAPFTAAPGTDPAVPPAAGQNPATPPPVNPSAPPYSYNYTYVPPVTQWAVPPDPYQYVMPPTPPIPPVPPVPDPNLHERHIPTGAIWLIGLGVLFLFGNAGIFHIFPGHLLVPFVLIGVGVWVFVRKMTVTGQSLENDGTPLYHWRLTRAINSSMWIVLTGVLFLLDELRIIRWSHSWPLYLIAGGVMVMLKRSMYPGYGYGPSYPVPPPATPAAPVTGTDIVPTGQAQADHSRDSSHEQEGR
jgi:hypothetical protein